MRIPRLVGVTGPVPLLRLGLVGRALIRAYDMLVAPPRTSRALPARRGRDYLRRQLRGPARRARRGSADSIARIEFHGEDTNLGRRLTPIGSIDDRPECWVWTSARRYRAMGKRHRVRPVRPQLLVGDSPASPGGHARMWT